MSKLIIDMPKKYLTDASGFVSCAMGKKYLPLLYRDCHNNFKGCLIKGVLPDEHGDLIDRDEVKQKMIHYGFHAIDMTATEFCEDELQTVIAAERKDDEQIH